jgi:hypothetical protein
MAPGTKRVPRCCAAHEQTTLIMPSLGSTLAPIEAPPPRPCFVDAAPVAGNGPNADLLGLPLGHSHSARITTSLQHYPSGGSARPLWQTSLRKGTETFRKGPEGRANEPLAAASFNPEM